jgi:hypothetical protein
METTWSRRRGLVSVPLLSCSGLELGRCAPAARSAPLPPLPEGRLETTRDKDVEHGGCFAAAVLEVVRDARRDATKVLAGASIQRSATRNDIVPAVTRKSSSFESW